MHKKSVDDTVVWAAARQGRAVGVRVVIVRVVPVEEREVRVRIVLVQERMVLVRIVACQCKATERQ